MNPEDLAIEASPALDLDPSQPLSDHFLSSLAAEDSAEPEHVRRMAIELVELRAAVKAHWAAMLVRGGKMDAANALLYSRLAIAKP